MSSISSIHLTPKKDHAVILNLQGGQSLVVDFSLEDGNREVEFTIDLVQLCAAQGNRVDVKFSDLISFQVAGQANNLSVSHDANAKEVTYKASGANWQGLYPSQI